MKFKPDATPLVMKLQLSLAALIALNERHKTVDDTIAMAEVLRDVEGIAAKGAADLEQMAEQDRGQDARPKGSTTH